MNRVRLIVSVFLLFCLQALTVSAQSYRDHLRSGNRHYRDSMYTEAEVDYRKVIELNPRFPQGHFNLGNALLRQQKPKEAMKEYEQALKLETNKKRLSAIHHNMGVILQSQKQYGPAIECYKNALRNNPADNGSRYNLVLCQYLLKKNPQQQENKGSDQKNDNGSGKSKEQDKKGKQQDKQQQKQNKDQEKQQQQGAKQQQNQNKMSKENAEQLLKAAMQDEKSTQDKVKKAMSQPQRRRLEKQW